MKTFKYKNHTIARTRSTTTVSAPMPFGKLGHYQKTALLYRVEGIAAGKEEGKRPFLTSVNDAKEYINDSKHQTKGRKDMNKKLKLTNNFHGQIIHIIPKRINRNEGQVFVSERQFRRITKKLCGITGCQCKTISNIPSLEYWDGYLWHAEGFIHAETLC